MEIMQRNNWVSPRVVINNALGDARILITHCVGEAFSQLHEEDGGELIRKSFLQNGIGLRVDSSEDDMIKVRDIPDIRKDIMDAVGM